MQAITERKTIRSTCGFTLTTPPTPMPAVWIECERNDFSRFLWSAVSR